KMERQFNKPYKINSIKSFVNRKKRHDQWGQSVQSETGERTVIKGSGEQVSEIKLRMTSEQSKDPDYILQAHGYDPTLFEVIKITSNVWEQNSAESGLVQLYQSKIVVKPKTGYSLKD